MLANTELFIRLLLAAALGSVIGFERERLLWAAGLRTHMLVCVGSSLIMIVSAFGFSDIVNNPHVVLDPSRIAAQVVSGIGFLGAGTILLRGEVVKGLTTAASLWSVAAIGLAVGGGLYTAALSTTVIILVILAGIKPLEERFRAQMAVRTIRLSAEHDKVTLDVVHEAAGLRASRVKQFVLRQRLEDGSDEVLVSFIRLSPQSVEDIAGRLRTIVGVRTVEVIG
ncbi:MgtC/SapB family protein [Labrys monachus]|uniref:Protein MgtC n=1 Tax=Labrys monachus TaxID=217067 RepID=A0ABU0FLJ7_9HYPH|nr:MgtC/SapB family protein [Labrys monachus]MDQ0395482.1 putative Mg2+ transporter-C (MgtC) family protein [Labrys monachus]